MLIKTMSLTAPKITIVSENEEDKNKTELALSKIGSFKKGRELLNEIKSLTTDDRFLEIHTSESFNSSAFLFLTESQLKKYKVDPNDRKEMSRIAKKISQKKSFGRKGEGVNVIIDFHPTQALNVHQDGTFNFEHNAEISHLNLAHELIHGWHIMKGKHLGDGSGIRGREGDLQEEFYTVGIGKYADSRITENKIRKEQGYNERKYYLEDGSM